MNATLPPAPVNAHEYTAQVTFIDRLSLLFGGEVRVVVWSDGQEPVCVRVPAIPNHVLSTVRRILFGRRSIKIDHKKFPITHLPSALA